MKTGLQHFMMLSPAMAKMCIEAAKKSQREHNLHVAWNLLSDAVMNCITWANTTQREKFWNGFITGVSGQDKEEYRYCDGRIDADSTRQEKDQWEKGFQMGLKAKEQYENRS